jgi:hypothetical protein
VDYAPGPVQVAHFRVHGLAWDDEMHRRGLGASWVRVHVAALLFLSSLQALPNFGNRLFDWDGLDLLGLDLIEATASFSCPEASILIFEQGIQAFSETICRHCPGGAMRGVWPVE